MLILTRRIGESLIIGDDIILTVLGVKGRQARLGIDAPEAIPVNRFEIYQKIQFEKEYGVGDPINKIKRSINQLLTHCL